MNIAMTLTVATACVAGLTGCASKPLIEELPVSESLPPIERPVYQVGMTTHQINPTTGEESSWKIKSIAEDGVITGLSSDGCEWHTGPGWFPQVLA